MEEKIVVKKDHYYIELFLIDAIGMLIFVLPCIWLEDLVACLGFLALFGSLGAICAVFAYIPKLELGHRNCTYRTVYGKTRHFFLTDIAEISKEMRGKDGLISMCLFDKNRKRLAVIQNNMENYETACLFFQMYDCASKVWNGEDWVAPHKICFPEHKDTLEVKEDRKRLLRNALLCSLILGIVDAFFCWLVHWVLGIAVLLVVPAMMRGALLRAKYERLILTQKECLYVNCKGDKVEFLFTDIKEAEIQTRGVGRNAGDVLVIKDVRDKEIACVNGIRGAANVPAFIEYWQKRNRKKLKEELG